MNYSRNGRRGGYEKPNISIATDEPDLPALRDEIKDAIDDAWDFYERNEHALDVRYCNWDGQTRDGRK